MKCSFIEEDDTPKSKLANSVIKFERHFVPIFLQMLEVDTSTKYA